MLRHNDPSGDQPAEAWTHEINTTVRSYQKKYGGQDLGVNGNASMLTESSEDVWGKNYPQLRKIKVIYQSIRSLWEAKCPPFSWQVHGLSSRRVEQGQTALMKYCRQNLTLIVFSISTSLSSLIIQIPRRRISRFKLDGRFPSNFTYWINHFSNH
jgi:hypothetical protein